MTDHHTVLQLIPDEEARRSPPDSSARGNADTKYTCDDQVGSILELKNHDCGKSFLRSSVGTACSHTDLSARNRNIGSMEPVTDADGHRRENRKSRGALERECRCDLLPASAHRYKFLQSDRVIFNNTQT